MRRVNLRCCRESYFHNCVGWRGRRYGAKPGIPKTAYANNCLLARRLAERGVRFIQVYHAGWDHHSNVAGGVRTQCRQTDQATAALIFDPKQRCLLEDALGFHVAENPVHVYDVQATILHCLGIDHRRLTFKFRGLNNRITGVEDHHLVKELLA